MLGQNKEKVVKKIVWNKKSFTILFIIYVITVNTADPQIRNALITMVDIWKSH